MVTIGNAASTKGVPNIPGDQQEGVRPWREYLASSKDTSGDTWKPPEGPWAEEYPGQRNTSGF